MMHMAYGLMSGFVALRIVWLDQTVHFSRMPLSGKLQPSYANRASTICANCIALIDWTLFSYAIFASFDL